MLSPFKATTGLVFSLVLTASTASSQASSPTIPQDPREILLALSNNSQLDADGIKPWHLRATIQSFAQADKPTSGVIEEWFFSKKQFKITYNSPDFSQTEIVDGIHHYLEGSQNPLPLAAELPMRYVTNPIPFFENDQHLHRSLSRRSFGKAKLSCVSTKLPGTDSENYPMQCFDPQDFTLRVIIPPGKESIVALNSVGKFLGKNVATEISVDYGRKLFSSLHITTLESLSTIDPEILRPTPGTPDLGPSGLQIGGPVTPPELIHEESPHFPKSALNKFVDVFVLVRLTVGADGHAANATVERAPTADFAAAALEAVRQFVFKPARQNGHPISTKLMIDIHFEAH